MKLFRAVESPRRLGDKKGTRTHKEVTSRWAGGVKVERLWDESQVRDLQLRSKTHWDWLSMGHSEKQTSKEVVGGRILPVRLPRPLRAAPDSYWGSSRTHGNLHSDFHACCQVPYKVTLYKVLHERSSSSLSVQGAKAKEPCLALNSSPKRTFQARVLYLQFV